MLSAVDQHTISALSPRAVIGYLKQRGWISKRPYGAYGVVFSRADEDGTDLDLVVPITHEARDYTNVMAILVSDLAQIEDRAVWDVVEDFALSRFDVIQIRSTDADSIGSIDLSAGVELHERALDLITAAANAAAAPQPRPAWQGRPYERAGLYINALRLGQSQRGSFVLSLLSPWEFMPTISMGQASLFTEMPFGRLVTQKLASALQATRHAIDRATIDGVRAGFSDVVNSGVSANFCSALARLAQEGDGVDISLRWSSTRPEQAIPRLALRRDDAQVLIEARDVLVETHPIDGVTIEGVIQQVTNDPATWDGHAILVGRVDGSLRRVRISFSDIYRQHVFSAAQSKLFVRVTGDLEAKGRRLRLLNPRDLSVIDIDDDQE